MVVDGVSINAQGVITMSGTVDKGIFGEDPLSDHIGPDKFPKLEMRLEDKLLEKFVSLIA